MLFLFICCQVAGFFLVFFFFFFKQKTAYEIMPSLVGSEMCIRDSPYDSPATRSLEHSEGRVGDVLAEQRAAGVVVVDADAPVAARRHGDRPGPAVRRRPGGGDAARRGQLVPVGGRARVPGPDAEVAGVVARRHVPGDVVEAAPGPALAAVRGGHRGGAVDGDREGLSLIHISEPTRLGMISY